jgi:hypothetical protein
VFLSSGLVSPLGGFGSGDLKSMVVLFFDDVERFGLLPSLLPSLPLFYSMVVLVFLPHLVWRQLHRRTHRQAPTSTLASSVVVPLALPPLVEDLVPT